MNTEKTLCCGRAVGTQDQRGISEEDPKIWERQRLGQPHLCLSQIFGGFFLSAGGEWASRNTPHPGPLPSSDEGRGRGASALNGVMISQRHAKFYRRDAMNTEKTLCCGRAAGTQDQRGISEEDPKIWERQRLGQPHLCLSQIFGGFFLSAGGEWASRNTPHPGPLPSSDEGRGRGTAERGPLGRRSSLRGWHSGIRGSLCRVAAAAWKAALRSEGAGAPTRSGEQRFPQPPCPSKIFGELFRLGANSRLQIADSRAALRGE